MKVSVRLAVVAGVLLLAAASVVMLERTYRESRSVEVAEKFQLLAALRRSALETYFNTVRAEVSFWSVSDRVQEAMLETNLGWQQLGDKPGDTARRLYITENIAPSEGLGTLDDAGDGSAYSAAHARLHELAREFVTGRGYYDFFLIDLDGNVIYSVEKEDDYGSNLLSGPYRDSGLGIMFRQLISENYNGQVLLTDFARYAPSNNAPAIFAGQLISNAAGRPVGILAVQLPTDTIQSIMRFTEGMGESGETYLVGADRLMRSDSRFSDASTVLQVSVDTETVALALDGEQGVQLTPDYRGIMVLSAYDYIDFDGIRWAVMAEIDASEMNSMVGSILTSLLAAAAALLALLLGSIWALRDLLGADDSADPLDIDFDSNI